MKIYSVFDPEFHAYGQIVDGMEDTIAALLEALAKTPQGEAVAYVPEEPLLQNLRIFDAMQNRAYGGMPIQIGMCWGYNTRLNCLEYHRDSEVNVGETDFVLLLAKQDEIKDGKLDTAKVKAFWAPAGTLVEVYATTLHYAPCHMDAAKGFRVMVALPKLTNTDKPDIAPKTSEDQLLWARNKWLLAHAESSEARQGAAVRLEGVNLDIADSI